MKLHERLHISLTEIDTALEQVVLTDLDLPHPSVISDGVLKLIRSGGKRLRPILVLIGGRFGVTAGKEDTRLKRDLLRSAVLMEYVHMASLVHDDIIDEADTRRGEPALHRQTDVRTAMHIADYMIARVMEWSSSNAIEDEQDPLEGLVALVAQLCLGEYGQMEQAYNFDQSIRQYLRKTRNKTAVLMAACLKAGAEVAGADDETIRLLYRIGDYLGMAFQIQDDILDYTQDERTLGKPAGSDLRSGNITLPVLYALERPALAAKIRSLTKTSSESDYAYAIAAILASPACAEAAALRDRYIDRAEQLIDRLAHYPAHHDLKVLLQQLAQRAA